MYGLCQEQDPINKLNVEVSVKKAVLRTSGTLIFIILLFYLIQWNSSKTILKYMAFYIPYFISSSIFQLYIIFHGHPSVDYIPLSTKYPNASATELYIHFIDEVLIFIYEDLSKTFSFSRSK
jgi:hypothetical protein